MELLEVLKYGLEYFGLYYGVYKAQVVSVDDPSGCGRLQLFIPQVHGQNVAPIWAWPKAPVGGNKFGLWWIPSKGDWVYVTFDHGRAEFPIWEGGWWAQEGEVTDDMVPTKIVLATAEGMKLVIDREAETVLLEQSDGNSLSISSDLLSIVSSQKVQLQAPGIVAAETLANAQALVTNAYFQFWVAHIYPFLVAKGYIGPPAPANSVTTVVTGE